MTRTKTQALLKTGFNAQRGQPADKRTVNTKTAWLWHPELEVHIALTTKAALKHRKGVDAKKLTNELNYLVARKRTDTVPIDDIVTIEPVRYVCSICSFEELNADIFVNHMKDEHEDELRKRKNSKAALNSLRKSAYTMTAFQHSVINGEGY